jgi:hypothetical protein
VDCEHDAADTMIHNNQTGATRLDYCCYNWFHEELLHPSERTKARKKEKMCGTCHLDLFERKPVTAIWPPCCVPHTMISIYVIISMLRVSVVVISTTTKCHCCLCCVVFLLMRVLRVCGYFTRLWLFLGIFSYFRSARSFAPMAHSQKHNTALFLRYRFLTIPLLDRAKN